MSIIFYYLFLIVFPFLVGIYGSIHLLAGMGIISCIAGIIDILQGRKRVGHARILLGWITLIEMWVIISFL